MSTGVYVAINASAKVDQFSFDPVAGQLAALSPASVATQGTTPQFGNSGALTYDGVYCYVVNQSASKISQFSTDSTGKLTALSPSSISFTQTVGSASTAMVLHPNGGYAYCSDGSTHIGQFSVGSNGQLAALSPSTVSLSGGSATSGLGIAQPMPGAYYLYAADHVANIIGQYSIDSSTGKLTALSPASIGASTSSGYIVVDPTQRWLYATNSGGSISQFSIAPTTGLLTAIASPPSGTTPRGIAVDATGRWVYVVDAGANVVRMYSINQTTGALVALSTATIATGTAPYSITIDPTNSWVYVTDYNAGAGTTVHQYGIQNNGILVALSTATVTMDAGGFWIFTAPQTSLLRQKMPIGIT